MGEQRIVVRIFQPYGAHIKFDGVQDLKEASDVITFTYRVKDQVGTPTQSWGRAAFQRSVISGYAVEVSE